MSALKTWLGELALAGYSVAERDGWVWIQGKSSLTIWVEPLDKDYTVSWAQGVGRGFKKTFDTFDEMADWVNEKLRSWPDHYSGEKPIGEMPDD